HFGELSSLPDLLGVDIHVKLFSPSQEQTLLAFLKQHPLRKNIWQIGELSIEEYCFQLLLAKKITLSFAESCTGGNLSDLMTNIAGSSKVFQGAIVAYQAKIKQDLLHVQAETLKNFGVVSEQVAQEM